MLSLGLLADACQVAPAPGTAPPTALQTFDVLYTNAVTAVDIAVKTATSALQAGLINVAQAKKVRGVTTSVKTALDAAYAASQLGNVATANGDLASALGPIAILSACLTIKPLTVATFDSCTVALKPVVVPT